ncbi:MAG TPA: hypothetical protein ENG42_00880 [Candidatus Aenigmarchaeota archaeon]|nr:MAG: hypothetical protein DRP03_03140 [Candidatus Aenigmarchaeota archaeon]HDD46004.1 hypothetical protein [Candidatus Aenigmarchaeota archaeon]
MPIRQTAKKVRIADLNNGEWVRDEEKGISYVLTRYGDRVARARIMATVVNKFVNENRSYANIVLDDGSDTIRAKFFENVDMVDKVNIGDIVDVIGRVREYDGEVYLLPEIIRNVKDINEEIIRMLEIVHRIKMFNYARGKIQSYAGEIDDKKELEAKLKSEGISKDILDCLLFEEDAKEEKIKDKILRLLEENPEGLEYSKILEVVKGSEVDIENAINELLAEGLCYEPTPGKVKKI